ncbi:hypothetical protein CVT24_003212 [Panaeolus cyanescens]|uniref:Oxidoreductase AflY n=1 Tax=Panaeolus cyanescens TaxID=181874 RepID=A0A409VUE8_9AGAR|nr:hypothetical protein CVT24_003212 [Panaeolus cyanescens]
MAPVSFTLNKKGTLNLPGITAEAKKTVEQLLLKDVEDHHCFFNASSFHNHLSHHLLAAYDIGTPVGALKKMYDEEAKVQRPRYLQDRDKNIVVNKDNWIQYLNNNRQVKIKTTAYGAFVDFFEEEVRAIGASNALEKYIFSEDANKDGRLMFVRFTSGALHPFIQIGYGVEFGNDELVVSGMAQAAMHKPTIPDIWEWARTGPPTAGQGLSLLEILREAYDSSALKPGPYDGDKLFNTRMAEALANGGDEAIKKLVAQYHITNNPTSADISKAVEEIIWTATLLMFGSGRPGRKPRLDFFLMHIVTSSIFLKHFAAVLKKPEHQAALIRTFIANLLIIMLSRGRPRIDAGLAMAPNAVPRPPVPSNERPAKTAIGDPNNDADYNPWPALIEGVQYHSDPHVVKAMRTLLFAAQEYGATPAGGIPGAFRSPTGESLNEASKIHGEETHVGIGKVDGTLFVRSAGVLMDTLGWLNFGQEEGEWDRSALGWDGAWAKN